MGDRQRLGRTAEDQAAEYLLGLGYSLVTRRFRVKGGEIDLVALDGDVVVFVEVKVRYAPGYLPEEAIGETKVVRWQRTAEEYMRRLEDDRPYRFDVIAIDGNGLRHHRHIFNA